VIKALAHCYLPKTSSYSQKESITSLLNNFYIDDTTAELTRYLRKDGLVPSFQKAITEACLYAFRILYIHQIIPLDLKLFLRYSLYHHPRRLRYAAFESLIILALGNTDLVRYLLEVISVDLDTWIRLSVAKALGTLWRHAANVKMSTTPPIITANSEALELLLRDLWDMLNQKIVFDNELRLALVDLHYAMRHYIMGTNRLVGEEGKIEERRRSSLKSSPPLPRLKIVLPPSSSSPFPSSELPSLPHHHPSAAVTGSKNKKKVAAAITTLQSPKGLSPMSLSTVTKAQAFSTTQAYRRCKTILARLKAKDESWPFLEPVNPVALNVPTYFDVIKQPMDLGTIEQRLNKKNFYHSMENFEHDVRLIFSNCFLFNLPGDLVYDLGKKMESAFNRLMQREKNIEEHQKPPPPSTSLLTPDASSYSQVKDLFIALISRCEQQQLFSDLVQSWQHLLSQLQHGELNSLRDFKDHVENSFTQHLERIDPTSEGYHQQISQLEDLRLYFEHRYAEITATPSSSAVSLPSPSPVTLKTKTSRKSEKKRPRPLSVPSSNTDLPIQIEDGLSSQERIICENCLQKLFQHKDSFPFHTAVDAEALGIPQYYEIIKNPMDLSMIRKKLSEQQAYSTRLEFEEDIRLMFSNCYYFNGLDAEVSRMAKRLERYFDQLWTKNKYSSLSSHHKVTMKREEVAAATISHNIKDDDKTTSQSSSPLFWREVLKKLKGHRSAWPFLLPVDAVALGVSHYYDVIKQPMDLSTIERKLDQNDYTTQVQFEQDIRLIFQNCLSFNAPDTAVYLEALKLEQYFNRIWCSSPSSSTANKRLKLDQADDKPSPPSPSGPQQEMQTTLSSKTSLKIKLKLPSLH
jgi:hypothetical protein